MQKVSIDKPSSHIMMPVQNLLSKEGRPERRKWLQGAVALMHKLQDAQQDNEGWNKEKEKHYQVKTLWD